LSEKEALKFRKSVFKILRMTKYMSITVLAAAAVQRVKLKRLT